MGKHDKTIATSSEEFLRNENENLRKKLAEKDRELAFASDTIKELQKQCSRMSKWASEIEANAKEDIDDLEAEVKKWKNKALSLVEDYVGRK